MPLGRPSITTPNRLELQAIQQAFANIRERFRAVEESIGSLGTTANNTASVTQKSSSDFQAEIARIDRAIAAITSEAEDGSAGREVTFSISGTVDQGDPVRLTAANSVARLDPDDIEGCAGYLGVAKSSATGGSILVCLIGIVEIPGAAFTAGLPLYVGPAGVSVTHTPTGNAILVGYASSATHILVSGTGGVPALRNKIDLDTNDDYLPITLALATELPAEYLGCGPIYNRPYALSLPADQLGLWFDTNNLSLSVWDGLSWTDVGFDGMPTQTIKGRTTAGFGAPEDLTPAEAAEIIQGDGLTVDLAGFRGIPQNPQSAAYTLVASDAGRCIYHPAADVTARTWTIPSNASVPFPIGTAITFDNDFGAGALTIAITSDTLVLVGSAGSTGSRTIASGGQATAIKVTATRWRINGTGLT